MLVQPLEYQWEILENIEKDRSKGKTLVVLPSGSGKTHVAAFDSLNAGAKSVLYIAHRVEILEQAARIFKQVHQFGEKDYGYVSKNDKSLDKRFVFATNLALYRKSTLDLIKTRKFDYVVIDEFHHVAASTYKKILSSINARFILGLTATPYRYDRKNIHKVVDDNVAVDMDLRDGIKRNILVPFLYNGLYDNIDYSDIHWDGKRYKQEDLDKKLLIDKRDKQIIEEYREHIGPDRPTIGFCVSAKHCERITLKFNKAGISARYVTYKTPTEERAQTVKDFLDSKFSVLFTRDLFNEGVDFPNCEGLMFLRPTFSKTVFLQQLGRGLRKKEGKTIVTVLDFIGNYHNAFLRQEWIETALKGNYEIADRPIKPVYEYDVPVVYFQSEVVDIFKAQKLGQRIGESKLIQNYFEVSKKLGYYPTSKEFAKLTRYSLHSYFNYFGTWQKFLEHILIADEYPHKRHAPMGFYRTDRTDSLIENYWNLKKILGRIPKGDELNDQNISKHSEYAYVDKYGSFTKFLVSIGERETPLINFGFDIDWCVDAYNKLAQKLGRRFVSDRDWIDEYNKKGLHQIRLKYGGFREFRKKKMHITDKDRPKVNCIVCGAETQVRNFGKWSNKKRFCSSQCSNQYHKEHGTWKKSKQKSQTKYYSENRDEILEKARQRYAKRKK